MVSSANLFQFQWASAVHAGLLSHFHAILEKNSGAVNCYCYWQPQYLSYNSASSEKGKTMQMQMFGQFILIRNQMDTRTNLTW